jgi:hypothetical protein
MKDIINKIMKIPAATPFLYPVDQRSEVLIFVSSIIFNVYFFYFLPALLSLSFFLPAFPSRSLFLFSFDLDLGTRSLYPEYYEAIENPMDLTTLKKSLASSSAAVDPSTSSLNDVLDRLRLIWKNCISFNVEGSEISVAAIEVGEKAEELVEATFGKAFVNHSWHQQGINKSKDRENKGKARKSESHSLTSSMMSNHPDETITLRSLKEVVEKLYHHELAGPFLHPVKEGDAPGYCDVVKIPMDLGTVRKKLKNGSYPTSSECIADVERIWENCRLYNDPASDIVKTVNSLSSFFDHQVRGLGKVVGGGGRTSHRVSSSSSSSSPSGPSLKDMAGILKSVIDYPYSEPFYSPVSEKIAPHYYDIVKNPICLSDIEKKIKQKEYVSSSSGFDSFISDVTLVWNNCQSYNTPNSEIYNWADLCRKQFQLLLKQFNNSNTRNLKKEEAASPVLVANDETKEAKSKGRTIKEEEPTSLKEKKTSSVVTSLKTEGESVMMADDDEGVEGEEEREKSRAKIPWRERKYRSIVHQLASEENSVISLAGDKLSSSESVSYAMIRDELKNFLESPDDFLIYVYSLFYTLEQKSPHLVGRIASTKAKLLDLFLKAFPQSAIPPDLDTLAQRSFISYRNATSSSSNVTEANSHSLRDHHLSSSSSFTYEPSSSEPSISRKAIQEVIVRCLPSSDSASLLSDPSLLDNDAFLRSITHKKAVELLKSTKFPLIPNHLPSVQVTSFGSLDNKASRYFERDLLFPVGFSSSVSLRLQLLNSDSDHLFPLPFVNVLIHSTIEQPDPSKKDDSSSSSASSTLVTPDFVLFLENGVEASRASSPLLSWKALENKETAVIKALGSRLSRCRAVFNRLCISPDAVPFLDQVPLEGAEGSSYYKVITSPMWLGEIHHRLVVDGSYDNEYDFAWDMRLIFANCKAYNLPDSSLAKAADRLQHLFEWLLCCWVYNIGDRTIDDLAKGAWDDWMYLKYFDEKDPKENFCRLTGEKGKASDLIQCRWCDDQFLPSSVGLRSAKAAAKSWACSRCQVALDLADGDLKGEPFINGGQLPDNIAYLASEVGKDIFVPAFDMGGGWFQAKKKGKGGSSGLKNLFLSPLGYEVHSKEEIRNQIEFEKEIDEELRTARAKEWKELVSAGSGKKTSNSNTTGKRRKGGRRQSAGGAASNSSKDSAVESAIDSELLEMFDSRHVEEGRIVNGKLNTLVLAPSFRFVWCYPLSSSSNSSSSSSSPAFEQLKFDSLPSSTGFYGLELKEVRSRLEGLSGVLSCDGYHFMNHDSLQQDMLTDYERKKKEVALVLQAGDTITDLLLKERWEFEKKKTFTVFKLAKKAEKEESKKTDNEMEVDDQTATAGDNVAVSTNEDYINKMGFKMLSYPGLSESGLHSFDNCFVLWDFLESFSSLFEPFHISFAEFLSSLLPPSSILHTIGQVIFDEICSGFTEYLFRETMKDNHSEDVHHQHDWQALLMVHPINSISWPKVAEKVLLIMSLPLSSDQKKVLMNASLCGESLSQLKILSLLLNHPFIDDLIISPSSVAALSSYVDNTDAAEEEAGEGGEEKISNGGGVGNSRKTFLVDLLDQVIANATNNATLRSSEEEEASQDGGEETEVFSRDDFASSLQHFFENKNPSSSSNFSGNSSPLEDNGHSSSSFLVSDQLWKWLKGLLGRIGYFSGEMTENDYHDQYEERVGSMDNSNSGNGGELSSPPSRTWGGYTARKYRGSAGDDVLDILLPWNFEQESSTSSSSYSSVIRAKMKALSWLERSFCLMSSSDPENWSSADRLAVYLTFVDFSMITDKYLAKMKSASEKMRNRYDSLFPDDLNLSSVKLPVIPTLVPKGSKCFFTGIEYESLPDPSRWAVVPQELVTKYQKISEEEQFEGKLASNSSSSYSLRSSYYAIKDILLKILKCRDRAAREHSQFEVRNKRFCFVLCLLFFSLFFFFSSFLLCTVSNEGLLYQASFW